MKDNPRQQFRWAPHVTGQANVKAKDYEQQGQVSAANEYEAWAALRASGEALDVGDLFESESGDLTICKYVGFEPARWIVPEAASEAAPESPAAAQQA